jgi:hypothetical protein
LKRIRERSNKLENQVVTTAEKYLSQTLPDEMAQEKQQLVTLTESYLEVINTLK